MWTTCLPIAGCILLLKITVLHTSTLSRAHIRTNPSLHLPHSLNESVAGRLSRGRKRSLHSAILYPNSRYTWLASIGCHRSYRGNSELKCWLRQGHHHSVSQGRVTSCRILSGPLLRTNSSSAVDLHHSRHSEMKYLPKRCQACGKITIIPCFQFAATPMHDE